GRSPPSLPFFGCPLQVTDGVEFEFFHHPFLPDVVLTILGASSLDEMSPLATRTQEDGWTLHDNDYEIARDRVGMLERVRLTSNGGFERYFFSIKMERIEAPPSTGLLANLLWHFELNDSANGPRSESLGTSDLQDVNGNLGTAGGLYAPLAASFGGAGGSDDDYLEIASQPEYQLAPDDSFTICGWFYPTDLSNWSNICWNGSEPSDDSNFGVRIHDSSRYWAMQIGNQRFAPGNQVAQQDTWQFVVWYFDNANDQVGISVNGGAFVTADSFAQPGPGGFLRLGKGAFWNQNTYDFEGRMQGVGFWRNRVLTSEEVVILYNSGAGLPFSQW
ncbi:MAG: LamG-like jellyroll fold domain-containing protein, partial [Verrucomicrobiota bacterium]